MWDRRCLAALVFFQARAVYSSGKISGFLVKFYRCKGCVHGVLNLKEARSFECNVSCYGWNTIATTLCKECINMSNNKIRESSLILSTGNSSHSGFQFLDVRRVSQVRIQFTC